MEPFRRSQRVSGSRPPIASTYWNRPCRSVAEIVLKLDQRRPTRCAAGAARRTMERNWKWRSSREQHVLRILCAPWRRAERRRRPAECCGRKAARTARAAARGAALQPAVLCAAACSAYRSYPWQRPASAAEVFRPAPKRTPIRHQQFDFDEWTCSRRYVA